ncbi:unnamed protein product [Moneuplotes crassus]|uniref:Uncharacterized protein n=1 Tax=Euplotes crassus TaxID=5936 RepID=A0AAD1XKZ3_EUPCR|nr:unnamed protein product [Moneuplotes crassus]
MDFFNLFCLSWLDLLFFLAIGGVIYMKKRSNKAKRAKNGDFKGKKILITGGTSGIGKALAEKFSKLGANVIITGRDDKKLQEVSKTIDKCEGYVLDMENPEEVEKWCENNTKNLGTLDAVIHNAGLSMRDLFMNTEIKLGQRLLNVDFLSIFAMIQGLMGNMRTDEQGSVICGIGSLAGVSGAGVRSMYSAIKGANDAFFKCLACEIRDKNIHSMIVHPGYIQTNVSQNALVGDGQKSFGKTDSNIKNGLPVEDCVNQIIDSIVLRKTEVWVCKGFGMKILMFISKIFPSFLDYGLYKNLNQQLSALKKAS